MKTITFTPDSMALIDGEIYLLSKDKVKIGDYGYSNNPNERNPVFEVKENMGVIIFQESGWSGIHKILDTTNISIPNVKHIYRSLFVKPDVDVEEMAQTNANRLYSRNDLQGWVANVRGYADGYNANKKEFTREEVEQIHSEGVFGASLETAIKRVRSLSIPNSVICDEEYNVLKINW